MHLLGLAGMPRRIPGIQSAFTYSDTKNDCDDLVQIGKVKKNWFHFFLENNFQRDKYKSRKDGSFGQCTKIDYEMPYTRYFAFVISGSSRGIVDQVVNTQVHVSLCPNEVRAGQCSNGKYYLPHIFTNRKAGRALNKLRQCVYPIYYYHVNSYNINYEILVRDECGNTFETVESWHEALISFDKEVQLHLCTNEGSKSFFSSLRLTRIANNLVLSYFRLVSKIIRDHQQEFVDVRIIASNIPPAIERLQCLFIESTAVRYFSIQSLFRSSERFIPGVDGLAFLKLEDAYLHYQRENLLGTKYNMSTKSIRIKKDLPKKAQLTEEIKQSIKQLVDQQNLLLSIRLFQSSNPKTFNKNYKSGIVKRI